MSTLYIMSILETNEGMPRRGSENMELSLEAQEKKEEELEKKMAAKERAEKVGQEMKSTQKTMQNIMANIQQVLQAVRQIRQQLGLDINNEDVPSVKSDQKTLEQLKQKLAGLISQMDDLKLALKSEEITRLRQINPNLVEEELGRMADKAVKNILSRIEN
jgi:hypothetical protein